MHLATKKCFYRLCHFSLYHNVIPTMRSVISYFYGVVKSLCVRVAQQNVQFKCSVVIVSLRCNAKRARTSARGKCSALSTWRGSEAQLDWQAIAYCSFKWQVKLRWSLKLSCHVCLRTTNHYRYYIITNQSEFGRPTVLKFHCLLFKMWLSNLGHNFWRASN